MKKALVLAIFPLMIVCLIGITLACTSNVERGNDELVISLAPIHEVTVNIAESYPPQLIVHIKGGLSDGCTTFHGIETERNGNTVNIEVTTERPQKAVCTQIYGYFEKSLNLGSDFTSGETYIINVNDVTTSVTMP